MNTGWSKSVTSFKSLGPFQIELNNNPFEVFLNLYQHQGKSSVRNDGRKFRFATPHKLLKQTLIYSIYWNSIMWFSYNFCWYQQTFFKEGQFQDCFDWKKLPVSANCAQTIHERDWFKFLLVNNLLSVTS